MTEPTQPQESVLEVGHLPTFAFGHRSLMWWGMIGMMVIEGMVLALLVASYFYLYGQATHWPLSEPPPDLLWGSVNTAILLASVWPNQVAKHAAEHYELVRMRRALLWSLAFAFAFLVVRIYEFRTLNCHWDTDAYGSAVWTLLGLHTAHLITDVLDTVVLTALMHVGPLEGKRFADVSENSLFWNFVVLTWLPIYGVLYWMPRLGASG